MVLARTGRSWSAAAGTSGQRWRQAASPHREHPDYAPVNGPFGPRRWRVGGVLRWERFYRNPEIEAALMRPGRLQIPRPGHSAVRRVDDGANDFVSDETVSCPHVRDGRRIRSGV